MSIYIIIIIIFEGGLSTGQENGVSLQSIADDTCLFD